MIAGFAVFYLLVLVRILAFFSMMPLFDQKRIPAMWKVAVGVLFTIIVIPMLTPMPFTVNVVWIAFAVLWEAVLGFCFGMVFTTAVGAVLSAGSLVDMQMGFANAGILNPGGEQPEPLIASFMKTLFMLSCLVGSAHLAMVRILLEGFHWFPVGAILHRFQTVAQMGMALIGQFFTSILWLVLPICLALLASEVCIAFLSRLIPQMNMLISAAPIRSLAGLMLVTFTLPFILESMSDVMTAHFNIGASLGV